jgi:pSer/pThr/pTyr-binding forkhead associated (FHA) protein
MEDTNTRSLSRPEAHAAGESPYLMVIAGRRPGEVHKLASAQTVVGRSPQAALQLDGDGISREHAELVLTDGRLRVRDLGSTNGTHVNGERLGERATARELHNGDQISIGTTTLLVFTHEAGLDRGSERPVRDPETSALRRAAFLERLAEEISFSRRRGAPLALLTWEVDALGPDDEPRLTAATRRLLRAAALRATEALSEDDFFGTIAVGRYGVACVETTLEQARARAEALREVFAASALDTGVSRVPVTISVGVALAGPVADRTGKAAAALVRAAEAAVAVARARGGDRVEVATAPTASS